MSEPALVVPEVMNVPVAYIVCTPFFGSYVREGEALEFQAVVNDSAKRWGYVPYSESPTRILLDQSRISEAEYESRQKNLELLASGAFAALHISGFSICPYVRELIRLAYLSRTTIYMGYIPVGSPLARYLTWFRWSAPV
jgi:hypothetical protein